MGAPTLSRSIFVMSRHRRGQMRKSNWVRRGQPEPWYRKYLFWRDRSPEAKKAHKRSQAKLMKAVLGSARMLNLSPIRLLSFKKLDREHRREVMSRYYQENH